MVGVGGAKKKRGHTSCFRSLDTYETILNDKAIFWRVAHTLCGMQEKPWIRLPMTNFVRAEQMRPKNL